MWCNRLLQDQISTVNRTMQMASTGTIAAEFSGDQINGTLPSVLMGLTSSGACHSLCSVHCLTADLSARAEMAFVGDSGSLFATWQVTRPVALSHHNRFGAGYRACVLSKSLTGRTSSSVVSPRHWIVLAGAIQFNIRLWCMGAD